MYLQRIKSRDAFSILLPASKSKPSSSSVMGLSALLWFPLHIQLEKKDSFQLQHSRKKIDFKTRLNSQTKQRKPTEKKITQSTVVPSWTIRLTLKDVFVVLCFEMIYALTTDTVRKIHIHNLNTQWTEKNFITNILMIPHH